MTNYFKRWTELLEGVAQMTFDEDGNLLVSGSGVGGLIPMGDWDASSGVAPPATAVGQFWWITVAGTIDGVDYHPHDWIVCVQIDPSIVWKKVDNSDLGTDHALLDNLLWSVSGHIIDGNLDMRGYDIDMNADGHITEVGQISSTYGVGKDLELLTFNNLKILLGDDLGIKEFIVSNSSGVKKFAVDSLGNISLVGNISSTGDIILQPGKTVDGVNVSAHASDVDAHHNKSHAHNGVDGSGTVAHSDTTGQGTDDHHTKSHAHDGIDGSGTIEGTNVKSTGEVGGVKVLTENGTGGASWQTPSAGDPDAIHDNVAGEINAIIEKTTPVDADVMVIEDSADLVTPFSKKSVALSALKTFAQTGIEGTAIQSTSETEGLALITQGDGSADWQKVKMVELNSEAYPDGAIPASDGLGGTDVAIRYAKSYITAFRTTGVTFPNNDAGFIHMGGAGAITTIESTAQVRTTKMKVSGITGNCTGGSGSFTVRKNGVDTTMTGTISTTGQFLLAGSGDVDFAEDDLLSIAYSSGVNWTIYGIQLRIKTEVI